MICLSGPLRLAAEPRRREPARQGCEPSRMHREDWVCLGAGAEVLLRSSPGDQPGDVVELLRIAVDKSEGQLQPFAVRFWLKGRDSMQVAVEPCSFRRFTLL